MPLIDDHSTKLFMDALGKHPSAQLTRPEIAAISDSLGLGFPRWYANIDDFRVGRGLYRKPTSAEIAKLGYGYSVAGTRTSAMNPKVPLPSLVPARTNPTVVTAKTDGLPSGTGNQPGTVSLTVGEASSLVTDDSAHNAELASTVSQALGVDVILGSSEMIPNIPKRMRGYVEWGHFDTVSKVIASKHFLPVMVVGPSGNGKTEMIEQVCAQAGREFIRANITAQTDEDDLIGGFRLINGDTKYSMGPVPMAMLAGAVLLLDEVDLGGPAMMCLQPVLEGKPLYIKKIGKYISPAPGFTVAATANTKGRGDSGKYAHTTIMNEAMLERFAVMFEQGWPKAADEKKILAYMMKAEGQYDAAMVAHLVEFANATRKQFAEQNCSDEIATRRLIHIVRTFCTMGDINLVMKLTLARFDADTADGFMKLWEAIHGDPTLTGSAAGAAVRP